MGISYYCLFRKKELSVSEGVRGVTNTMFHSKRCFHFKVHACFKFWHFNDHKRHQVGFNRGDYLWIEIEFDIPTC